MIARAILAAGLAALFECSPVLAQTAPATAAALPLGFTVTKSPGGYEVAPPPGSMAPDAPPAASSSSYTASAPLGPQDHPGQPHSKLAHYLAVDIIAPPIVYSGYTTGSRGFDFGSYAARAAAEVGIGTYKVMVGADARRWTYPSTAGVVTGLAGQGRAFAPSFAVRDYDIDEHVGLLAIEPRIYAAVSYLQAGTNADAPRTRGIGYGLEKLVDSDRNFSLHGSLYLYPNVGGTYTVSGSPVVQTVSYREARYSFGATIAPLGQPFFLDIGYLGDRSNVRTGAPVGENHQGPYFGLGIRF